MNYQSNANKKMIKLYNNAYTSGFKFDVVVSHCGGLRSHVDDRRCPTLVVSADYGAALLSS
ncbi:hypothetical protein T4D_13741 [Trichinella pseudospiralis]|uniref:Uncharacterized protein n=1 Tax=Trichinella pseudospiralis TaxID=6337 RepID=A0A0V1FCB8_TRIPS|nr:hypothetical protein T4D_13741 [Trichinella pseudospiralis]